MKFIKWSSVFFLSILFMWGFIPQLSAKRHQHHHHHHHHCCRGGRSHFGFNFNIGPTPNYVVAPAPVVAPVVVAPAPVVYQPYPYYAAPNPGVYVQPSFSYSYRH